MKVKILYFSGTGNTQLITKKIKQNMTGQNRSIELIKADQFIRNYESEVSLTSISLLGIGFPVYDLLAPKLIMDIVKVLPDRVIPLPVFLYSTQSFIKGDCLNIVARALKEKGYFTILKKGFDCPSNGLCFYEDPNHPRYKHVRFEKNIEEKIQKFSFEIIIKHERFKTRSFHQAGPVFLFFDILRYFSRRLYGDKYYKNLKISASCSICKLCEKICPQDNFIFENNKMQIKASNGCMRCLKCVSLCPEGAVSFSSSEKKGKYNRVMMMKLYADANRTFSKPKEEKK
jgi:NAD-dependent dihydropyrimidine dehydrogenase PreA subunit